MSKSNSLENINLQFRTIMGKMGLDEEKQNKLSHKLDLSKKIKTIISMQTLEERKKKISEYLERISNNFSLMSFLSLHCSLENGNKTLFSIFMHFKGDEIILKLIKEMEGERVKLILEFVFMLLEKYEWENPLILEMILLKYLEIKFKSITFYKIIEFYIKKGDYEVLFKNTKPFGCVCSSYLSIIVSDCNVWRDVEGGEVEGGSKVEKGSIDDKDSKVEKVNGKINDDKDNGKVEKGTKLGDIKDSKMDKNIYPLNELQPNYSLLITNLLDLLKKGPLKKEYVNYIENIYLKKQNTILKKKCKSERLFEIIRIAEEKDLLDLVTCVIESVVIGGEGCVGGEEVGGDEGKDSRGKDVKIEVKDEGKDVKKEGKDVKKQDNKEESTLTPNTLNQPSTKPITQPSLNLPTNTPPNNTQPIPNQPPTFKKKIIKKIIKKSTPLFSYEQLKWSKINKKGTIFEKVTKIDFKDKDLEPFIKKEIIKKENLNLDSILNKKITIFPDKKNYALNIALSRIKLSDKELKDKILKLEPDCNLNLIKQLLIYFPNEEEKGVLRKCYDGSKGEGEGGMYGGKVEGSSKGEDGGKGRFNEVQGLNGLKDKGRLNEVQDSNGLNDVQGSNGIKDVQGPSLPLSSHSTLLPSSILPTPSSTPLPPNPNRAESFFIECIPQIDLFKQSLLLLNLKSLLDSLPISHLDTLSFYYQTILSSISLRDLLGTLLSLGNSLNKGTPLGQAEGFTFDSLLNLISPKTKEILKSYFNLNLFKKEFKILFEVQKISLESFKMDFKEVKEIKKEIKEKFKNLEIEEKFKKIEKKFKETNEFYEKASEYLNEKINEEFNLRFLEVYMMVVE